MNKFGKITCYILAGAFLITLGYFAEKIFNGTLGKLLSEETNNTLSPDKTVSAADQGTGNLLALIKNAPTGEVRADGTIEGPEYKLKYETSLELAGPDLFVHRRQVEKNLIIEMPSKIEHGIDESSGMEEETTLLSVPTGYARVGEYNDNTAGLTYIDTEEILSYSEYVEGYTLVRQYSWHPEDAIFVYSKGEGENREIILLNAYLHDNAFGFLSADWKYEGLATYELAQRLGIDPITPNLGLNDSSSILVPKGLG